MQSSGASLVAQEPVIEDGSTFRVVRMLPNRGELSVIVGDLVQPDTVVATSSSGAGNVMTLHLARELGVGPDAVIRYLTKPVGSTFGAGEAIARARRGLRTVTADAPVAGRLTEVNSATGTGSFVPETGSVDLFSIVTGEVANRIEARGVEIEAVGTKIRGALALGRDTFGPFMAAVDRNDRELTPDAITPRLNGAIVLGGMTVSAVALRRLAEVGARAVIVGSLAEGEVRRSAATSGGERPAHAFWQAFASLGPLGPGIDPLPVTVFVTEGFGRRPMAPVIFQHLSKREGDIVGIVVASPRAEAPSFSYLYFTMANRMGNAASLVTPADGVVARLVDPQHLGTVVVCRSGVELERTADGFSRPVVEVELPSGGRRSVHVANLEILQARG